MNDKEPLKVSAEEISEIEQAARLQGFRAGAEAMRVKFMENAERSGLTFIPGLDSFLRDMPLPEMNKP